MQSPVMTKFIPPKAIPQSLSPPFFAACPARPEVEILGKTLC